MSIFLSVYFLFFFLHFVPLDAKKQTTRFMSVKFQKLFPLGYIILRIRKLQGKECRSK